MSKKSTKWGFIGFGVGAATGVATKMLLTSKKGKNTLKGLKRKAKVAQGEAITKFRKASSDISKTDKTVPKAKKKTPKSTKKTSAKSKKS